MSEIQVARVGIEDYEQLMINTIRSELRDDQEALRSLEVKPYIPTTNEEAEALRQTKGLFVVQGFLSLNGETGKAFSFKMEAGLTESEDAAIAEQLAEQCLSCVRLMKKELKGEHVPSLNSPKPDMLSTNIRKALAEKTLETVH